MNKKLFFWGGLILLSLFSLNSVFAQSSSFSFDLKQGGSQLVELLTDFFQPFLQALIGGDDWTGYLLFERFLIFILLISLVYLSLNKTPVFSDNRAVLWIISVAVPLLAMRFIDIIWLNTIFIQYKVLGVALSSIIPFTIYFFFLQNVFQEYPVVRKIGWVFFACIYIGLWMTSDVYQVYSGVYIWTALVSILFLFLDGTISKYMLMQKIKTSGSNNVWDHIRKLQEERDNYQFRAIGIPEHIKKKRLEQIEKQLKKYYKMV